MTSYTKKSEKKAKLHDLDDNYYTKQMFNIGNNE